MKLIDILGLGAGAVTGAMTARDERVRADQAAQQETLLNRLKAEQEAQDRAIRERLANAQIANFESLARERAKPPEETFSGAPFEAVGSDGKPGLFIRGSMGSIRPVEGVRPMVEARPARTQVVGESIVNLDTGTAEPIKGLPSDGQGRVSAATRTQVAENTASLDLIRRAREAVQARPESFGLSKGISLLPGMGQIGDVINQRTDPEGVAARQLVGNLSSRLIKDRSGAAVTVSEFPRLAAFIPQPYDTPEKILQNLDALERELQVVNAALANGATLAELGAGATPVAPVPRGTPAAPVAPTQQAAPPDFEAWRASRRQP